MTYLTSTFIFRFLHSIYELFSEEAIILHINREDGLRSCNVSTQVTKKVYSWYLSSDTVY